MFLGMERVKSAFLGSSEARKALPSVLLGIPVEAEDIVARFGLTHRAPSDPISDEAKIALALLKTRHIC